jgi:vitamin B12 transporter
MGGGRMILLRYRFAFILAISLFLAISSDLAFAQSEEEEKHLRLYFSEEDLQVVSATRSLKPISRVPENMTVITAEDIERMNAHTLDEVLNTVVGLQVFGPQTPGNLSSVLIQGCDQKYVTVLMDGVVINSLSSNGAIIGILPVQQIERIEIIKGPASASWGSALGGVINIITKGPPDKGISAMASASYGSNNTEDFRAAVRGRTGDFGLYIYAGGFHTNGFGFSQDVFNKNIYAKVTYALLPSTDLNFTLFYLKSKKGLGDFHVYDEIQRDKNEIYYGTLSATSRLSNEITLDASAWAKRDNRSMFDGTISTGLNNYAFFWDDRMYGTNARITWKTSGQTIVGGAEYNYWIEKSDSIMEGKQHLEKWALFLNDTISWGDLSVTPGVRFEDTSISGNFVSPSLGATYQLFKKTILRANVARGFYVPALGDRFGDSLGYLVPNPDIKVEKIWSYQVGAESADLKYVWLKASLFRHDISDIIDSSGVMAVNVGKQRRQGLEAEMKTAAYYNIWLTGGFTFVDARDLQTDQVIRRMPRYTYDLGLNYDDKKSFRASLRGRYIWWNADNDYNPSYKSFIFDISAAKKIYTYGRNAVEIFGAVHNIFNDKQYPVDFYKNPRRWAEIGLRYKF